MGVVELLEQRKLVVNHLLVALDILLQDDLDGNFSGRTICFADNAVGTSTLCACVSFRDQPCSDAVRGFGSRGCGPSCRAPLNDVSIVWLSSALRECSLLIICGGLAVEFAEDCCRCELLEVLFERKFGHGELATEAFEERLGVRWLHDDCLSWGWEGELVWHKTGSGKARNHS